MTEYGNWKIAFVKISLFGRHYHGRPQRLHSATVFHFYGSVVILAQVHREYNLYAKDWTIRHSRGATWAGGGVGTHKTLEVTRCGLD